MPSIAGRVVLVTAITTVIVLCAYPVKDKAAEPAADTYYAFRYQWVVYIGEGRVTAGPEKFGVVKFKGNIDISKLAGKFPKRDDDKPSYATHATDKLVEVPTFSSFTPITKEQFDIATKSKALSVNLE